MGEILVISSISHSMSSEQYKVVTNYANPLVPNLIFCKEPFLFLAFYY
ncbi:protein of unknown function [Xenorhabdus doucetiae]|uniref:Uncharacterized protein n=1 Tax=Xenorhabdus doucetiae TaxID=351671 RepID=A0A068QTF3_9GAMM|nr:protein of unknown function [Xenorhabdus doucetiae]